MSAIPFEIESINFVGEWNYVSLNNTCGICNCTLYKPVPQRKEQTHTNCAISMGKCKHAFHRKCIKQYMSVPKVCPYFNKGCQNGEPFKYEKELELHGTIKLFKH